VISLISAAVGVIGGHLLDFVTTRQLSIDERRRAIQDRLWTESGEMYRQLFAMRSRLGGSIKAHHFAALMERYTRAKHHIAASYGKADVAEEREAVLLEREKIQQVLIDRSQLEMLLGWADHVAPEGDEQWQTAIHDLVHLSAWEPSPPPTTSLGDVETWKHREVIRVNTRCMNEIDQKSGGLLSLIKRQRLAIIRRAADAER